MCAADFDLDFYICVYIDRYKKKNNSDLKFCIRCYLDALS